MNIELKRIARKNTYTIGKLSINGKYFCDTLEDRDRGIMQDDKLDYVKKIKIPNQTAIPTGTYKITLDVVSPKFSVKDFYKKVCNGKLPRLIDVPGYEGILIHVGDGPKSHELTAGCILVGKNTVVGQLTDGKNVFTALYKELLKDKNNLIITIS